MTDAPLSFMARLKRHHIFRVASVYAIAAWVLIQVANGVFPDIGLTRADVRIVIAAVALLFPVALVLGWMFIPPSKENPAKFSSWQHLRWKLGSVLTLVIVVLVVISGIYLWHVQTRQLKAEEVAAVKASAVTSAPAPTTAIPAKSIAVLAFTDLSPKHDQGYFSDGMSEEIRNALAQIQDLKVAGRSSSFYYKGRDEDLLSIGKTLGVANVLEGSVRKQGNEVRITAQLVRVADDTQLWSHAYDGNLSDVFKLQEDIARAITGQLKLVLSAGQQTQLVNVGTTNTAAYTLYLKATDVLNRRDYTHFPEAADWLRQAIKLDPDFARAHSRLALMLGVANDADAEAASQAHMALALDPSDAEAEAALGLLAFYHRRFLDSQATMERAFALAPNDASINLYLAEALIETGYTRQGVAHLDRALTIDPLLPNALFWRGEEYVYAGNFDAAQRTLQRADHLGLSFVNAGFWTLAEARGDHAKARALMLPFLLKDLDNSCLRQPAKSLPIVLDGIYGGDASARAKALTVINGCLAAKPAIVPGWAAIALLYLDQPQRVLDVVALGPTNNDGAVFPYLWSPVGQAARRLPTFAAFARKIGYARCGTSMVRPTIAARTPLAITCANDVSAHACTCSQVLIVHFADAPYIVRAFHGWGFHGE